MKHTKYSLAILAIISLFVGSFGSSVSALTVAEAVNSMQTEPSPTLPSVVNPRGNIGYILSNIFYGASDGAKNGKIRPEYLDVSVVGGTSAWTMNGPNAYYSGTGNVGISATGPQEKLEIGGGNILLDNNYGIKQRNADGTIQNLLGKDAGNVTSLYSQYGTLKLNPDATQNTIINSNNGGFVQIGDGVTSANFYVASGKLGIGTTAPDEALDVKNGWTLVNSTSDQTNRNYGVALWTDKKFGMELGYDSTWATRIFTRDTDGVITFGKSSGTALQSHFTEQMRITNAGDVGIGTDAPGAKLDVQGTTGSILANFGLSSDGGSGLFVKATGAAGVGETMLSSNGGGYALLFGINGAESARINTAGNMGIGTSNPTEKLEVAGNIRLSGSLKFNNNSSISTPTSNSLAFSSSSGTEAARIDGFGNMGIGTSNPTEKLEVAGNIRLSGTSPTYRVGNVASPVADFDAANKIYVDSKVSAGGVGGGSASSSPYLENGSYYSEGGDPYFCRLNVLEGTSQRIISVNQNKLCNTASNLYCNAGNCNADSSILDQIKQTYQLISTKDDQSCSINDGQVYCWGYTGNGQKYLDMSMSTGDVSGNGHTCEVQSTGLVKCWGQGSSGQLGNGAASSSNVPVSVSGINNAVKVYTSGSAYSTNYGYSCALLSSGQVKCWGYLPTYGQTNVPVVISGLSNVVDFSMSQTNSNPEGHWCAVLSDGTMRCSGTNTYGQLGDGTLTNRDWISGMVTVSGISNALKTYTASSGYSTNFGMSCALLLDKSVRCWGASGNGRIGEGFIGGKKILNLPLTGLGTGAKGFSGASLSSDNGAGEGHACSVKTNGTVQCWGRGNYGQLGDGTSQDRSYPVTVSGINNAIQVYTASAYSTNYGRSCALLSDKTVKCWGYLTNYGAASTPITIAGLSNVVDFSMSQNNNSGDGHWCAVISDGTARCAGAGGNGQLGNSAASGTNWISGMVTVSNLTTAVKIYTSSSPYSTSYGMSCALLSDTTIRCWGSNSYGQLGDGTSNPKTAPIKIIGGTATGMSLAGGNGSAYNHACEVETDGTVKCWGDNTYGQLGDGTITQRSSPVVVSGINTAIKVYTAISGYSTPYGHTCALLSDKTVKCWGYLPSYGQTNVPVAIAGLSNVVDFSMSQGGNGAQGHWCAALTDGTARCGGSGGYGQLGNGAASDTNWISGIVTVSGLSNVTKIYTSSSAYSTNYGMSCGLLSTGVIKCWGSNSNGQLGDGTSTQRNAPVSTVGMGTATGMSLAGGNGSAYNHACEVETDGTVKCWGDNTYGQLGNGTTTQSSFPVTVSGINTAVKVYTAISGYSTPYGRSCALLSDKTVKCWGYLSNYGQTTTPIAISSLSNVVDFSMSQGNDSTSYGHWCAVLSDGTARCGGNGGYGQLGNGAASNTDWINGTVTVSGLTSAVKIYTASASYSTSYGMSCAILSTGAVQCWGYNGLGQLGNGNTTQSNIPVGTAGMNTATGMSLAGASASGYNHACEVETDGTVKCWGDNTYGQLGNGTTTQSSSPVTVNGITNAVKVYTAISSYSTPYGRSCALLADKTVKCWGYLPSYGQTSVPIAITSLSGVVDFSMSQGNTTASYGHWCAVLTDGTGRCGGNGGYGQLGNGAASDTNWISGMVTVSNLTNATKIYTASASYSTSYGMSCAILSTGAVKCWGYNGYGQLGNGTTAQSNIPVGTAGMNTATGMSLAGGNGSAYNHACEVETDGTVKCWGDNTYGQLGNGTTTQSNGPVTVNGITNAVKVYTAISGYSTPYGRSCALLSDTTVKCWGYLIGYGQTTTPIAISSLSNVVDFSMSQGNDSTSYGHWCAVLSDGTGRCGGDNNYGQLGNATTTTTSWISMVTVSGLAGASKIFTASAGYSTSYGRSCALLADKTVKCWGYLPSYGQTNTPLAIVGLSSVVDFSMAQGNSNPEAHWCAVLSDGTMRCGGTGSYGQLGNGGAGNVSWLSTVTVSGITNATKVYTATSAYSTNYGHTCALLSDKTVQCWGYLTSYGQTNTPITISGLAGVTDFSMSQNSNSPYSHWCAVLTDGTVRCAGTGDYGQLGNGAATSTNWVTGMVTVTGLTGATKVYTASSGNSTTYASSCALLSDGSIKCWGYNGTGQLGNGNTSQSNVPVNVTQGVIGVTDLSISTVSGNEGSAHVCAAQSNGIIKCWGQGNYGQIGDGGGTARNTPSVVLGITNAVKIYTSSSGYSTNYGHTCALLTDKTVKCWGYLPSYGQANAPITITGLTNVTDFSMSQNNEGTLGHWCAVLSDGTAKCSGTNDYGQLGNGTTTSANWISGMVTVSGLTGASKIYTASSGYSTTYASSCALLVSGAIQCWGYNGTGQLGNGTTSTSSVPVNVTQGAIGVTDLSISTVSSNESGAHVCAVQSNGIVKCWGQGNYGQIGDGGGTTRYIPSVVSGITNAVKIYTSSSGYSTNYGHTCALLSDKTVKCWGQLPGYGQTNTPLTITGLSGVVDFSMSQNNTSPQGHWCAVLSDGTGRCGGTNDYGQLGNGVATTTNWISGMVTVSGLAGASKIYTASSGYSTGYASSCALLADGTIKCWGYNGLGQLGNGNTTVSYVPVSVIQTIIGATDLSISTVSGSDGGAHVCVVQSNGTVKCWGRGDYGQLGNGGTSDSYGPSIVSGIANATKVYTASSGYSTSYGRSCALLADKTVKCWGQLPFYAQVSTPVNMNLTNVVDFSMSQGNDSTSYGHWCAVLTDGTARCGGSGSYGQLGNSISANVNWITPVVVTGLTGALKIYTASASYSTSYGQSCVLISNGTTRCWGYNGYGQLGDGTGYSSNALAFIPNITGVTDLSISTMNGSEGGTHVCALLSDKTVKCWGQGNYGQLGDGGGVARYVPSTVSGITNATKIYTASSGYSTNYGRSCALLSDKTVKCWGQLPNYGQVNSPIVISGLSNVVDFSMSQGNDSASYGHWCAALTDGSARCSGHNDYGQLGNGTTTSTNWVTGMVTVTGLTGAAKIYTVGSGYSTSYGYSCAILTDGDMKCWGSAGTAGRLGRGFIQGQKLTNYLDDALNTMSATYLSLSPINSGSDGHICAVQTNGGVKCWGTGNYGQLGDGLASAFQIYPVDVSGIANAVKIFTTSAGYSTNYGRSCALLNNGQIKCWGYLSNHGQENSPVTVSGISTAVNFSMSQGNDSGQGHWCAILSDTTMKCSGYGGYGQLGDGTNTNKDWISGAVSVAGLAGAVDVQTMSTGYSTPYGLTCATLTTGQIKCWGSDVGGYGRRGDGTTTPATVGSPALVSAANGIYFAGIGSVTVDRTIPEMKEGITAATNVAAGTYHACAIEGGTVRCWGFNPVGQLGNNSTNNSTVPVGVFGIANATQIAAGYMHTCVILQDGTVKCWGDNTYGQLGNNSTASSTTPVTVTGIANATQISAGDFHTCVSLTDGTVKCWGNGIKGQLGDGTRISSVVPVAVSGLTNIARISSGDNHNCAVTGSGATYCWGSNSYGQVGNGLFTESEKTPVAVSGITTASRIGAGGNHTCVTLADATLRCWGLNGSSQQASTSYFATPSIANLLGTQNILTVVGGGVHTCVISTDLGNLNCFGGNIHGQLGIGNLNTTANVALVTYPVDNTSSVTSYTLAICETRDAYNGNLGGLDGANAICQTQCGQGYKMMRESELINFPGSAISANSYWIDRSQNNNTNCSNWTDGTSGYNGAVVNFLGYNSTYGMMNAVNTTVAACNLNKQILCGRGIR